MANIPRRPPKTTDFGFETIVNEKLRSKEVIYKEGRRIELPTRHKPHTHFTSSPTQNFKIIGTRFYIYIYIYIYIYY